MILESHFIASGTCEYNYQELSLFLLMYADDLVLFSESVEGLQSLLNDLCIYANKWKMIVNTDKTKIVVFRNGGNVKNEELWSYDNNNNTLLG